MSANVEILRLGPGDAIVLDRVAADVFDEPVNPSRLAVYLREPGHALFVACEGGIVVGQCAAVIHRHPDKVSELYIDEVGVTPSHRRRGIAQRLMEAAFNFGRGAGCGEAWVGTELDNTSARFLYRKQQPTAEDPFVLYLYEL
jgi:ribosomal protein S18 acetylase RimI-like enzyme